MSDSAGILARLAAAKIRLAKAKDQPRWPAGNDKGGQFAPKTGASTGGPAGPPEIPAFLRRTEGQKPSPYKGEENGPPPGLFPPKKPSTGPQGGAGIMAPQFGLPGLLGNSAMFPGEENGPTHNLFAPKAPPKGAKPHPAKDDKGNSITVNYPTPASDPATWHNPKATATFAPGGKVPKSMNGVAMESWKAPTTLDGWAKVAGQNSKIEEPPPAQLPPGKKHATGVVIIEPDGRVWVTRPTNSFGGYVHTLPKGKTEPGISGQANAIKEAHEETGLKVRITGFLGDFERDTSIGRYYVAERTGGTPADMGWESQAMRLVPQGKLKSFFNRGVDKKIADAIIEHATKKKLSKLRTLLYIGKAFNPNQPRWPSGSPLGGQFKEVGADGITLPPKIGSEKNPQHTKKAQALHALAQTGDLTLLEKAFSQIAPAAVKAQQKKDAGLALNYHDKESLKLAQYGTQLAMDVATKPKAEAAAVKAAGHESIDGWKQVGSKPGGSADGGLYTDKSGTKWLVKGYKNSEMAKNEVLASKLMEATGTPAPEMKLVELGDKHGGGLGVASKFYDGVKPADASNPGQKAALQSQFATHAWLANWDVVGLSGDNVVTFAGGVMNIDPGGALLYRAKGGPKGDQFNANVDEWDTLRDAQKNPKAAAWFKDMGASQLVDSAMKVGAVDPDTIKKLVDTYGPGTPAQKEKLAALLIERQSKILEHAGAHIDPETGDVMEGVKAPGLSREEKAAIAVAAQQSILGPAGKGGGGAIAKPSIKSDKQYITDYYNKEISQLEADYKAGNLAALKEDYSHANWMNGKSKNAQAMTAYHGKLVADLSAAYDAAHADEDAAHSKKLVAEQANAPTAKVAATSTVKPALPDFDSWKIPDTNANAPSHNAKVDTIKKLAEAGDVDGLLFLGYGTNTYGKQQAKLANDALAAMGAQYVVAAGQKKGLHPKFTGEAPEKITATQAATVAAGAKPKAPSDTIAGAAAAAAGVKVSNVTPKAVVFKPAELPTPPDFANWKGAGQGLSSKPEINSANQSLAAKMLQIAQAGDEHAIDKITFKDLKTGAELPLSQHPSQHIRMYAQDLKANIKEQKYGPLIPTYSFENAINAGGIFDAIDKQFPELTIAEAASAPKKLGRYAVLGSAKGITEDGLAIEKISYHAGSIKPEAIHKVSLDSFKKVGSLEKDAIKHYTGSGYGEMNASLSKGQPSTSAEKAFSGLVKAMHPLPKGLVLSRKISGTAGQQLATKFAGEVGKVIQDPGIISTSLSPGVWSGHTHLKIIVGEGVHGLYVGKSSAGHSISSHPSEMELLLPPNTRFVVLSHKKGSVVDAEGKWGGSQEHGIVTVLALPNKPVDK